MKPRALLLQLMAVGVSACCSTLVWASTAEIVSLTGKGEYRAQSETAWHAALIKQKIDTGSFVRTGDLSAMAILFVDKTQIRLSQNSMFQLKASDPKTGEASLNLRRGRAWSQAKSLPGGLKMETPSAIAAIHGTDWEMEVDEEGRARLTVLHGEVEFYNEQGRVTVRNNEQALAEKGKAPVKLLLQNPAERVQWVTSYTVETARYTEMNDAAPGRDATENRMLRNIAGLIQAGNLKEAHDLLLERARASQPAPAVVFLLLADFAIYSGELEKASDFLRQGKQHYPADARIDAQQARLAMYRDDLAAAREILSRALARQADAAELKLAQGEIARFDGDAKLATTAYQDATRLLPQDSRGWHGLGVVENERENIKQARPHLLKALELNQATPGARGELATLETFANNLPAARGHFELALQAHPDDYIALTGLGLLQLKSGETETALETLLRASVIEPKYARAVVYSAVAYYQLGRHRVALETLARAAELDRHDPLPHQLASLIHTDLVEPGKALEEAREAMRLMPYLKSLNQLANDQKGAANLGNALAQFGLENWALNYAQESYNPFWAGSHLFLADRYSGKFSKQSELMQGYLTDPTAFGASNRFQTLLAKPGNYFSVNALASRSDDLRTSTPSFIANGYANGALPLAYFVEGMRINLSPGDLSLDGTGNTVTAALGLMPREDFGLFAFASSFDADLAMQTNPLLASRITGRENRLDLGMNFKFAPTSQSWLKIGVGEENARVATADRQQEKSIDTAYDFQPRNQDVQYRHSILFDQDEWTWGAENAHMDNDTSLTSRSRITLIQENVSNEDNSSVFYLANRHRMDHRLLSDAGLFFQEYDKSVNKAIVVTQRGMDFPDSNSSSYSRAAVYPRLGLAWTPTSGEVWRVAYQKWLRPISSSTLSPVATAGITLDDQVVLPGGEFERLRFQFERELSASTYAGLFLDAKQVNNLGQPGNVLNQREETASLDRLRNRAALVFQNNGEALEDVPVFLEGRIKSAGANLNQRLGNDLSGFASYVYTDSENTHPWFAGFKLPYMPRHRLTLGTTWVGPQRLVLQLAATYRTQRFTNENNNAELSAGWDAAFKANWQSADKRWLLEGYATNLLNKEMASLVGINAVWRY